MYAEIAKRHVEEYEPTIYKKLESLKDRFANGYTNHENVFFVVLGQAIDIYRVISSGHEMPLDDTIKQMIHECPEIFDFVGKKKSYDELLEISNKFDLLASELIFPIDMRILYINTAMTLFLLSTNILMFL